MPDENSKTEATLADLAVNLVLGRTPALADHYLGFDLIPGSVSETKTRAAGLLGFRIGQETVCIPVLFLNGKVKGTEILYMQDPDVFTSNSRQWIDYLLSKDSSTMGSGMTPAQPLRAGTSSLGMRTFSMNPGSITKSGEFFDNTARDFWNKIAEAPPESTDLHASPSFTLKSVLTKLGKHAYLNFVNMLDQNPALLAKVAQQFDLDTEVLITSWPEEKVAAPIIDADPFGGDAEIVCIRSSDLMHERLSKTAALAALDLPSKERCMRDGILFIDKRAEDSKTLVVREEYRHRFSAPNRNGFYEILNRGGELEKVFVAQNPLIIENPAQSLPGFIVLDPGSGVIVTPPMGQQVFVRSEFVTDEALWKKKFKDMTAVSSAEVNKTYILVSPSMRASAPFRVNGKVKEGDEMHLICDTPWEYKYRSGSMGDCWPAPCGFSSGSHTGGMVKVVDREDESRVARVGSITFVPSSWRLQEVYGDSSSLEYANDYVPPQESASEKKREERVEKRKAYFKILPGDAGTLNAVTINKDQFKLTLQKEASDRYQLGFGGVMVPMTRNEAMESMVMELDLPIEKAAELLSEAVDHKGIKAFLVFKEAGWDDITKSIGRGVDGLVQGADNMIQTPGETNSVIAGGLVGAGAGGLAGGVAGFAIPALAGRYIGGEIGASTSSDPEASARRKRIGALLGLLGGSLVGIPGAYIGGVAGAAGGGMAGAAVGEKLGAKVVFEHPDGSPMTPQEQQLVAGVGAGAEVGAGVGGVTGGAIGGLAGAAVPIVGGGWLGSEIGGAMSAKNHEEEMRHRRIGKLLGALSGGLLLGLPAAHVGAGLGAMPGAAAGGLIGAGVGGLAASLKSAADKGEPPKFPWPRGTPGTSDNAIVAWSDGGSGYKGKAITEASLSKAPATDLPDKKIISATTGKTASNNPFSQWAAQKLARHGLNEEGAIYGSMSMPDLSTDLGPNNSGVNEQTGGFANEVVPMNSMKDPADNWRDPDFANWDKMQQKDLDFLMRVADTGSKPVFESSMINLLLKTNRVSNQIEEWLPDLVNSLDSKCRLLLLFYWHSKDFSNDYGKDEMAEFEDVLLNSIKCDGQLVLFLKQSAGQSAHAMINPFQ